MTTPSPKKRKETTSESAWPDMAPASREEWFITLHNKNLPLILALGALLLPGFSMFIIGALGGGGGFAHPLFGYIFFVLVAMELWPLTLALTLLFIIIALKVKRKKGLILSALLFSISLVFCIATLVANS